MLKSWIPSVTPNPVGGGGPQTEARQVALEEEHAAVVVMPAGKDKILRQKAIQMMR